MYAYLCSTEQKNRPIRIGSAFFGRQPLNYHLNYIIVYALWLLMGAIAKVVNFNLHKANIIHLQLSPCLARALLTLLTLSLDHLASILIKLTSS